MTRDDVPDFGEAFVCTGDRPWRTEMMAGLNVHPDASKFEARRTLKFGDSDLTVACPHCGARWEMLR